MFTLTSYTSHTHAVAVRLRIQSVRAADGRVATDRAALVVEEEILALVLSVAAALNKRTRVRRTFAIAATGEAADRADRRPEARLAAGHEPRAAEAAWARAPAAVSPLGVAGVVAGPFADAFCSVVSDRM